MKYHRGVKIINYLITPGCYKFLLKLLVNVFCTEKMVNSSDKIPQEVDELSGDSVEKDPSSQHSSECLSEPDCSDDYSCGGFFKAKPEETEEEDHDDDDDD